MFEAYKVGVTLSLNNKVSTGLFLLTKDLARTQGGVAALQAKLDKMREVGKKAAYELGAAFVIAAPFAVAIADAARLQKEMIGIQSVTRGTTREMNAMRRVIETTAGQTVFSSIDVAKMGKTIASSTGLSADKIQSLLPEYAKFADVQLLLKGTPYEDSVKTAIRLAHTAGHYDADSLHSYLDVLTKASFVVPGGLGEVANALKYSQGMGKAALGVDDKNMVLLTALMNRLGLFGSRGGTALLAGMMRTLPGVFGSGLLHGKSAKALADMDMADAQGHSKFFTDGKFDAFKWMQGLSAYVAKEMATHPEAIARQDIAKNFQFAFGTNGAKVASLLSNPQAITQFLAINDAFEKGAGTLAIQSKFANESVWQKFENAKTNFTSMMTELGWVLLPMATSGLTKLNNALNYLTIAIHDHPTRVKYLAEAFIGLSAALAFGGMLNVLKFGFYGLLIPLKMLRFALLAMTESPLGLIVAGIALVVTAAYLVYTHWNAIKPRLLEVWHGITNWLTSIIDYFKTTWHNLTSSTIPAGQGALKDDGSWKPATNAKTGFAPPSASKTINVQTQVNLDGRTLASVVSQHQTTAANYNPPSGGGYDTRLSPSWVADAN